MAASFAVLAARFSKKSLHGVSLFKPQDRDKGCGKNLIIPEAP